MALRGRAGRKSPTEMIMVCLGRPRWFGRSIAVVRTRTLLFSLLITMVACAPAAPGSIGRGAGQSPQALRQVKTVAIGMDEDVTSIWDAVTSGGGTGSRELANVVNQHMVAITADGSPTPRLLAEVPSLE